MPSPQTTRRRGDQRAILAAMPLGRPVTAAEIAAKTGYSPNSTGALLRNAIRDGVVERAGERCEKRNGHWQMIPLWLRCAAHLEPKTGIDAEHQQWMAYWAQRRRDRLRQQQQNLRETPCRSTCNA